MKPSIYHPYPRIQLPNRKWPDKVLTQAPEWCSIDLREGNQALASLMSLKKKICLFNYLSGIGFKQIEVGEPGRVMKDIQFIETLVSENLIPPHVSIQVISQLKKKFITQTIDAVKSCPSAIINLFQSTSALRRETIFEMGAKQLHEHVVEHLVFAKQYAEENLQPGQYQFAFAPEGFNTTEPEVLIKICRLAIETLSSNSQPVIINFMAAEETDKANYTADLIELVLNELGDYENVTYSLQMHNDRGGAVASTELAMLAGIKRVEGTLLGNGERAGCCCLLTLALNLYTNGINPELDFSNIEQLNAITEYCTGISCPPRHPYAGDLVFAAFSAPHQFAIHEAVQSYNESDKTLWHVPYLPMDPRDIGRGNDDVIRLNALSGRTGITYVMEKKHGYHLPRGMQDEFSVLVKQQAQEQGIELTAEQIWHLFADHYFKREKYLRLDSINFEKPDNFDGVVCHCLVTFDEKAHSLIGKGSGPLDAVITALKTELAFDFDVLNYHQHALGSGVTATAISYVQIIDSDGLAYWGVGVDPDTTLVTLDALFCALNRKMEQV